ncbi:hypothetical protein TNIN_64931 [Trichonephila inaurata madagascariensis]|uniref:Reverse transcriptase/retrotransposon-derived protein RNase H-like domain-containing protein n=1 Tax=Trichonephila inaurata madagascariensis TaxID=2747483 RepID=A0A8X6M628_9ARAC|nr:hypothetical protein TNIN_64931 [Trichonephila inaurata madagascariensis]
MVNFYRRFLPSVAKYQAFLNATLSGLRGAQPVTWTIRFSQNAKKPCHMHPALNVPLGLFTDASAHHVGAALIQLVDANWKPLAFF